MRSHSLALTGRQHRQLQQHLFPGDGREAVAFALCGRRQSAVDDGLLVREVVPVPYTDCPVRAPGQVTWRTEIMPPLLEKARLQKMGILKIHSHPTDYPRFSPIDDASDRQLFPHIHSWVDDGLAHASAVMLPDGAMFGRCVDETGAFRALRRIRLVGDDLHYWPGEADRDSPLGQEDAFAKRIVQTFGTATYAKLRQLRVGVVGCSGTGSLVIEQLARNCVGEIVLVDPKPVEDRNLNRIPQATMADAIAKHPKVDVMEQAIHAMGLGVKVTKHPTTLHDPTVLRDLAACDVIFGCMDTVDGRHTLNRLASFYLLPYFDVGVKLVADGKGGIATVVGTVHYLQPDGSSLLSRHVYTLRQVEAAAMFRRDPIRYAQLRKEGYIDGVNEERPAVISVNMLYASLAINEFLARLHPYRLADNADFAAHGFSLSHPLHTYDQEGAPCEVLSRHAGRGDTTPFLDLPELGELTP